MLCCTSRCGISQGYLNLRSRLRICFLDITMVPGHLHQRRTYLRHYAGKLAGIAARPVLVAQHVNAMTQLASNGLVLPGCYRSVVVSTRVGQQLSQRMKA